MDELQQLTLIDDQSKELLSEIKYLIKTTENNKEFINDCKDVTSKFKKCMKLYAEIVNEIKSADK